MYPSQKDGVRWLFCEDIGTKASGEYYSKSADACEAVGKHEDGANWRRWRLYSGGVYYWSYIYYLSKYLEFIDTLFKVCAPAKSQSTLPRVWVGARGVLGGHGCNERGVSVTFLEPLATAGAGAGEGGKWG